MGKPGTLPTITMSFYPSAMKALSVNSCHRFAKEELNVKYWRVRYLR